LHGRVRPRRTTQIEREPSGVVEATRNEAIDVCWGGAPSRIVLEAAALDGTPPIDMEPVMREFPPRRELRQPQRPYALVEHHWEPGEEQP
jgi:hypothetical protein